MGDFYMVDLRLKDKTLSQLLIEKNYALPNLEGGSPKIATVCTKPISREITAAAAIKSLSNVPKNLVRVMNGEVTPSQSKNSYSKGELELDIGGKYEVVITNVETINDFYIQLAGIL